MTRGRLQTNLARNLHAWDLYWLSRPVANEINPSLTLGHTGAGPGVGDPVIDVTAGSGKIPGRQLEGQAIPWGAVDLIDQHRTRQDGSCALHAAFLVPHASKEFHSGFVHEKEQCLAA